MTWTYQEGLRVGPPGIKVLEFILLCVLRPSLLDSREDEVFSTIVVRGISSITPVLARFSPLPPSSVGYQAWTLL